MLELMRRACSVSGITIILTGRITTLIALAKGVGVKDTHR
jgi:hypothetical protein